MILFGGFYKYFHNPIESVVIPSGSDVNYSFTNAEYAKNKGLEAELRKSLGFIHKSLNDFSIYINSAIIDSRVHFTSSNNGNIKVNRALQGQSPYIFNSGIYYENEKNGLQINVQYNIIGKRIIYVGQESYPDVYEMPRNLVDFSISKKVGEHLLIKGGIQDLLNQPILNQEKFAEENLNGSTTPETISKQLEYKRGMYITLGITANF